LTSRTDTGAAADNLAIEPAMIEVVSFTGDSGLADYAVSLARALSAHHRSSVVTSTALPSRFDGMGFEVFRIFRRSRHYVLDMPKFLVHVLRRRPDWIVLQGPLKFAFLDGLCIRLLRLCGQKAAITVHDVLPHYPKPWSRFSYGFYYRSFIRVIAHSDRARNDLVGLGIRSPVLVVPHGIYDVFKLTGVSRKQARRNIGGLANDDFVVLFFGNLEPRKGLMEFLGAARRLAGERQIKFLIAGADFMTPHGRTFADALAEAGAESNVVLRASRVPFEDVENFFAACDLVALPYLEGTTSGVLKLALAFERPMVATSVGDFPEQVPADAGLLIQAGENLVDELTLAIRHIQLNQADYVEGVRKAGANAQWPDIAVKVAEHLAKD
jgi:glycosyltransferase involved in cell wall biosynthesis